MSQGWIKLHRQIIDWEWYQDANTSRLFIHLLLKANHNPKKWQGINIDSGQVLTSRKMLSNELGLSEQQIRTSLKKLEKSKNLTIKTTNKNTLISLCNYEYYQHENKDNQPANQPTNNQRITNKQPTNNQQITTNKNDKKVKNGKKYSPPISPQGVFEVPKGIEKKIWQDFEDMRKAIKKPMTDRARSLIVNKLIKINQELGQCPNEILEQSIINSWAGVFEIRKNNTITKNKKRESFYEQTKRAVNEFEFRRII